MSALSPASAEEVLVRRNRTASTGSVGPSGASGSAGTSARSSRSSTRSRTISERRRPPEPKASKSSARSRRSIALPRPQVASNSSRMSRVIAPALFRAGGRSAARMERRNALRMEGLPNGPSTPRQRCSVAHSASRRRTVAGACGPDDRSRPSARRALGHRLGHAVIGIFLALRLVPQMVGDEAQHGRLGSGPGERRRRSRRATRPRDRRGR